MEMINIKDLTEEQKTSWVEWCLNAYDSEVRRFDPCNVLEWEDSEESQHVPDVYCPWLDEDFQVDATDLFAAWSEWHDKTFAHFDFESEIHAKIEAQIPNPCDFDACEVPFTRAALDEAVDTYMGVWNTPPRQLNVAFSLTKGWHFEFHPHEESWFEPYTTWISGNDALAIFFSRDVDDLPSIDWDNEWNDM